MRTISFFVLIFGFGVAASAEDRTAGRSGDTPQLFVVRTIKDDTITFVQVRDGAQVNETVARIKDMVVRSTDGEILAPKTWLPSMVKGGVVVLSSDDRSIDCVYARVLKAGTLLITVKASPEVLLFKPRQGTASDVGKVVFTWNATGTDLQERSVSLFYAEKAAGPWRLIAGHLENSGEYAWRCPLGFPVAVLLRVQAEEKDATTVRAQTPKPVLLLGMEEEKKH